jgi:hypothetical protein
MKSRLVWSWALLAALLFTWGGASGQADKDAKADAKKTKDVLGLLRMEFDTGDFQNPMTFKDFLELLRDKLAARKETLPIIVDARAFKEEADFDVYDAQVRLVAPPGRMSVGNILRAAFKAIPGSEPTLLLRRGQIEITTRAAAGKEHMLNQTFFADFNARPLDEAMEELSELTGVSVVIDARVKEKAKTPVTARFRNDVAMQDAVRMLAEMSELKLVHLVTGLFITTPAQAQVMQKELKQLYEPPPLPAGILGVPGVVPLPPEGSPLTPPLPPSPRRDAAAAAASSD